MRGTILEIVSGMGILIGVYLFLSRGNETASIIKALSSATAENVKALQGR